MFDHLPRAELATRPTPLERGPELPGGARLWMKRDDLTGLGGGGNKARKLEFLCGAALDAGADALVTVGAAQSNHCRMTAAAGALLGLDVHLVLSGNAPPPEERLGNQLLSGLFGATFHHTGRDHADWAALEAARSDVTESLRASGRSPYSIPIGGSTAVGALGYVAALAELLDQVEAFGLAPSTIVFTSSSGGTHAGLVAGQAMFRADDRFVPEIVAVGVAKGVNHGHEHVAALADEAIALLSGGRPSASPIDPGDVEIDPSQLGPDYAVPTTEADQAIRWAARRGGWLMDRVYTGKGFAGLLAMANEGRFSAGEDVVFIHTGGWPALFAADGVPAEPN